MAKRRPTETLDGWIQMESRRKNNLFRTSILNGEEQEGQGRFQSGTSGKDKGGSTALGLIPIAGSFARRYGAISLDHRRCGRYVVLLL
jgi:hypothetical protein